jgi:hypothetical protein
MFVFKQYFFFFNNFKIFEKKIKLRFQLWNLINIIQRNKFFYY